ncbi:hypothetical protein GGR56DRAFT_111351 [Xylariaceae sp. FL0804]|nr:hypothetical protein GGR56DRAFT_111351 [Xylariaceae sp. FL0804]
MADWLRLGSRSRTPNSSRPPSAASESAPPRESRESRESYSNPSRRSTTRVSSYLSLTPEPLSASSDASLLVRDQDKVWYNPSLTQMVEALQVTLMTRGTMEPIPVEYNTYILHLIEGFANSEEKIRAADAAQKEARESLEQNLEQFRLVADDWVVRERQYKAEIKRLEVLISRTSQDGLEAVALARTNSVVDRSGPESKQFAFRLKHLSKRQAQGVFVGHRLLLLLVLLTRTRRPILVSVLAARPVESNSRSHIREQRSVGPEQAVGSGLVRPTR